MSDDDETWRELAGLKVVPVEEEGCHWKDCNAVALYLAVMTRPCGHRWAFCVWHQESMMRRQEAALAALDDTGEWTCPIGEAHKVGLVMKWESARG